MEKSKFYSVAVLVLALGFFGIYAPVNTTKPVQAALANVPSENGFRLEISTACDGGGSVFRVVNNGDNWPARGSIKVFRVNDSAIVSERRMALRQGQNASFRIKGSHGPLGMWVDASGTTGSRHYAEISCG